MSRADVDECNVGDHRVCSDDVEICRNTLGSYECHCRHGYTRDHVSRRCYGTTSNLTFYFAFKATRVKTSREHSMKRIQYYYYYYYYYYYHHHHHQHRCCYDNNTGNNNN